jgi:signal transduction histidine kinase
MLKEYFYGKHPDLLKNCMDIFPQEVVFLSKDNSILWMNKSKKKQHPKLKVGMKCFQAFDQTSPCDFCLAPQADKIASGIKNPVCIMTGRNKSKPRHMNITICPLKILETQAEGYIEIVDNVEALYQSYSQLELLNREYESVIYALSHDLRSPLISIEGFLRKLQKISLPADNQPTFEHCLKRIHSNVEVMNNLVNLLLDTSRIITGKFDLQEVDMEEFLKHIVEDFRMRIGEQNASIEIKGSFGTEKCDKIRVQQVYSNLIGNALKHGKNKLNLEIELGTEGSIYWVKDNGPGMAPEIKEKVFESFTQGANTDQSSFGMGMNIVYKIIQKHGGEIWIESEEDKGTTVYFTLKADQ